MNKVILCSVIAITGATLISGCSERAKYNDMAQAGANPPLPSAKSFFTPPMQVPKYVGWQNGETPKVAEGLKIEKHRLRARTSAPGLLPPQWRHPGG